MTTPKMHCTLCNRLVDSDTMVHAQGPGCGGSYCVKCQDDSTFGELISAAWEVGTEEGKSAALTLSYEIEGMTDGFAPGVWYIA